MRREEIENKILEAITQEKTNIEIAEKLSISVKYVEYLIRHLKKQLKVKSRVGLACEYLKEIKCKQC